MHKKLHHWETAGLALRMAAMPSKQNMAMVNPWVNQGAIVVGRSRPGQKEMCSARSPDTSGQVHLHDMVAAAAEGCKDPGSPAFCSAQAMKMHQTASKIPSYFLFYQQQWHHHHYSLYSRSVLHQMPLCLLAQLQHGHFHYLQFLASSQTGRSYDHHCHHC